MAPRRPRPIVSLLGPALLLVAVAFAPAALVVGADEARADEPDAATLAQALARTRQVEEDLMEVLDRVRAASVSVVSSRLLARGAVRLDLVAGVGSGVLIDWGSGRWVVTNQHVVRHGGRLLCITADGRRRPLRIQAQDERADLALLAFVGDPPRGDALRLPRAPAARPDEGAWVLATGNPFFLALDGLDAASLGVVSGIRPGDASAYIETPTIQHDAEINPGSSGGPLWNLRGELVGINGTIATRARESGSGPSHTGASFAIPVADVIRFVARTLGPPEAGDAASLAGRPAPAAPAPAPANRRPPPRVTPVGVLGVRFRTLTDEGGLPRGALITGVRPSSPAAPRGGAGGLQRGDVVTSLRANGRGYAIRDARDFRDALRAHPPGTDITVVVQRSGEPRVWSGRLAAP